MMSRTIIALILAAILICGIVSASAATTAASVAFMNSQLKATPAPTTTPSNWTLNDTAGFYVDSRQGLINPTVTSAFAPAMESITQTIDLAMAMGKILVLVGVAMVIFMLIGNLGLLGGGDRYGEGNVRHVESNGDRNIRQAQAELERAGVIPAQRQDPAPSQSNEHAHAEPEPVERSRWQAIDINEASSTQQIRDEPQRSRWQNIDVGEDHDN